MTRQQEVLERQADYIRYLNDYSEVLKKKLYEMSVSKERDVITC